MQHIKQPKLTKRQRKLVNGPNAASVRSIMQGNKYQIGDHTYHGRPAVINYFDNPHNPARTPGLPFVRVTH